MKNLVLREVLKDQQVVEHPLDQIFQITAKQGAIYSVVDTNTEINPDDLLLVRKGDQLEVRVADKAVANIDDFYGADSDTLYSVNGSLQPSAELTVSGNQEPNDLESIVWWQYVPINSDPTDTAQNSTEDTSVADVPEAEAEPDEEIAISDHASLTVAATAGQFQSDASISIYDRFGTLIGMGTIDPATSQSELSIATDYQGPILVVLEDSNGLEGDYIDETTDDLTSLDTSLRAMAFADGNDLFVSVTPLTELAAREANLIGHNVTSSNLEMNDKIGKLFGVEDVLAPVTTVLDQHFAADDGISISEHYGLVLASLSGADNTTGHLTTTLNRLENAISSNGDVLALTQGAVILLKEGISAFEAGTNAHLADINTSLIQPPIVDVPADGVDAQTRNSGVSVVVSGVTVGDSVTVNWGDKSVTKVLCTTDIQPDGMAHIEINSTVISTAGIGYLSVNYQINDGPTSPSVILEVDTIHDAVSLSDDDFNSYATCPIDPTEFANDTKTSTPDTTTLSQTDVDMAQEIVNDLWEQDVMGEFYKHLIPETLISDVQIPHAKIDTRVTDTLFSDQGLDANVNTFDLLQLTAIPESLAMPV
ncbi:MAG: hypothetical protein KC477_01705 [Oceanospirillaceae bacterium]|nr:hypothetical protein [Oceanospirillaceae bacterium]